MGKLYPVQVQEVLPGDSMRVSTSALIRMSPMLAPVMHPCHVRFHHWFVPNRILWDEWEDFITGGPNNDNTDVIPQIVNPTTPAKNLLDYMGVPPVENVSVNALPVRAFNKIWNEFYRDQDLQEERLEEDLSIPNVAWSKDYFTTSRPWTQKGADITIPIGTQAPIAISEGSSQRVGAYTNSVGENRFLFADASDTNIIKAGNDGEGISLLYADLSQATGITANEFRELFALQRYAEARAQYGSRYVEYLRYLGVNPSDARLQRPEYIGGGKSTLQFSEVLTTYDNQAEDIPAGSLRGHGITALKTRNTKKFFEEHGYFITVMSVVPKSIYADGMARTWLRQDKEDFYQRELQNIGQQKLKQGEIDASDPATLQDTFGYTDRYCDYTTAISTVAGEFRTSLDYWHLARKFDTPPLLNASFIECNPSKRIFAEQTTDPLWCMINNSVVSRRMVKSVGVGKLS